MNKRSHAFTALFLMILFVFPVALLLVQTFSGRWAWPRIFPEQWSWRAWKILGNQAGPLLQSLGTSLSYSLATTLLSLILCLAPAAALVRGDLPRRGAIETLLMAPVMVPPVAFSLGIHFIFLVLGLADSWVGVVLVLTAFAYPYMLRALIAGYTALGEDFATAATNLGANPFRRLLGVELPLLVPAAVSGGSVVFLVAFSNYFLVFLVGGGSVTGFSGYLFPFLSSSDRPVAASLTLLFLGIPLVLFGILETTVTRWYRHRGMGDGS